MAHSYGSCKLGGSDIHDVSGGWAITSSMHCLTVRMQLSRRNGTHRDCLPALDVREINFCLRIVV